MDKKTTTLELAAKWANRQLAPTSIVQTPSRRMTAGELAENLLGWSGGDPQAAAHKLASALERGSVTVKYP